MLNKRSRAVLALLVVAGGLWALSTQDFAATPVIDNSVLTGVRGEAADADTAVLSALAAIMTVISLLIAMLGRIGRWVAGCIYALAGLGYAGASLGFATADNATALPWVGVAGGLVAAGLAVLAAIQGRQWKTASSKYETKQTGETNLDDPAQTWDALSRGEDPS